MTSICKTTGRAVMSGKNYSRFLIEKLLGRELEYYEHVHHIDGDVTNDDISNLRLLHQSDHRKEHVLSGSYKNHTTKITPRQCIVCGKFSLIKNKFFCDNKCKSKFMQGKIPSNTKSFIEKNTRRTSEI